MIYQLAFSYYLENTDYDDGDAYVDTATTTATDEDANDQKNTEIVHHYVLALVVQVVVNQ